MKDENQHILSITELNNQAKNLLERHFTTVWVVGELSNLARPSSGHIYFSLKDNAAQVRCAMFRSNVRQVDFDPEAGQQVIAQARVSLYTARGDYQLIVQSLQLAGAGALQVAFDKLKNKLQAEGLFSDEHKQAIPDLPRCVGIITSATGAAVHDILRVMRRRFPLIPAIVYPTLVQGEQATPQIVQAIQTANDRAECDVLIVARGGGSLEDLWCFNEEAVARAIYASHIPIVSGVGHEVDVTIADFVADYRAATPSAAAEWVTPDAAEWQEYFNHQKNVLIKTVQQKIQHITMTLMHLQKRLRHPGFRLQEQAQQLDRLEQRLMLVIKNHLGTAKNSVKQQSLRLQNVHPQRQLSQASINVNNLAARLTRAHDTILMKKRQQLANLSRALDAISPLQTLERGYSITTASTSGQLLRSSKDIRPGTSITTRFKDGTIQSTVDSKLF